MLRSLLWSMSASVTTAACATLRSTTPLTIQSPQQSTIAQCQPAFFSWVDGEPPYSLEFIGQLIPDKGDPDSPSSPLEIRIQLSGLDSSNITIRLPLATGWSVSLNITDSASSSNGSFQIIDGSDAGCLMSPITLSGRVDGDNSTSPSLVAGRASNISACQQSQFSWTNGLPPYQFNMQSINLDPTLSVGVSGINGQEVSFNPPYPLGALVRLSLQDASSRSTTSSPVWIDSGSQIACAITSMQTTPTNPTTPSQEPSSSAMPEQAKHSGAIIAAISGTVGGLVLLIIVILTIFILRRDLLRRPRIVLGTAPQPFIVYPNTIQQPGPVIHVQYETLRSPMTPVGSSIISAARRYTWGITRKPPPRVSESSRSDQTRSRSRTTSDRSRGTAGSNPSRHHHGRFQPTSQMSWYTTEEEVEPEESEGSGSGSSIDRKGTDSEKDAFSSARPPSRPATI